MHHRSYIPRLLLSIIIIIASASSCVLPNLTSFSSQIGRIAISIEDNSGVGSLGLYPAPYRYIIRGNGPDEQTLFQQSDTETITVSDLSVGIWELTVTEVDPANLPLKAGTIVTEVKAAQTIDVIVPLNLATGDGTLSFSVTWADGFATNPNAVATITPSSGPAIPITFTTSAYALSSAATVASGPYTLDYTIDDDGTPVAGNSEEIWIFPGVESYATYDFQYESGTSTSVPKSGPSITVAWDPPAVTSGLDGFHLYIRTRGAMSWIRLARTDLVDPEWTFTDQILAYGEYEFGVSSVLDDGTESGLHTSLDPNADPTEGWYLDWSA